MSDSALVMQVYNNLGSWPKVAEELGWSASLWWQVGHNRRPPTRKQHNAACRYLGLPEMPAPPAEVVATSGVKYVIRANGDDPDTAILARTGGEALSRIRMEGAGVPIGDGDPAPQATFTSCKTPQVKRKPRATGILTLADIPPVDPAKIGRGKSGNQEAIRAAVARAAAAMRGEGE